MDSKIGTRAVETPAAMIIRSQQNGRLQTPDGEVISLGSSDYLGLATSHHVRSRLIKAVDHYGTGVPLGATQFSTPAHQELAERLAAFLGYEAVSLLGSGTLANMATLMTLAGSSGEVLVDEESHPSMFMAADLTELSVTRYPHLGLGVDSPPGAAVTSSTVIASDGVFSIEGEICDVRSLMEVQERRGAKLVIDDAHGVGAIGPTGRGTCEAAGCLGGPYVLTGSFSKGLGGAGGGYVAGDAATIEEIERSSMAFTATTRIAVHTAVAALASLDLIEAQPHRLDRLREICAHLRQSLATAGIPHSSGPSPITVVHVGDEATTRKISAMVLEAGYFMPALLPPVTPAAGARLRLIPSLDHEEADLDAAVAALRDAWVETQMHRPALEMDAGA